MLQTIINIYIYICVCVENGIASNTVYVLYVLKCAYMCYICKGHDYVTLKAMIWLWIISCTHMYERCYLTSMMKPYWIWQMSYDEYNSMIWTAIWHNSRKEKSEKDMNMICKWLNLQNDEWNYLWECWLIIQSMICSDVLHMFRNGKSWYRYEWIALSMSMIWMILAMLTCYHD